MASTVLEYPRPSLGDSLTAFPLDLPQNVQTLHSGPRGAGSSRWARFSPGARSPSQTPSGLRSHSGPSQQSSHAAAMTASQDCPAALASGLASRPITDVDSEDAGSDAFAVAPSSPGAALPPSLSHLHASYASYSYAQPTGVVPSPPPGLAFQPSSNGRASGTSSLPPNHAAAPHSAGNAIMLVTAVPTAAHNREMTTMMSAPVPTAGRYGGGEQAMYHPSMDRPPAVRFRDDLMLARTTSCPVERYKVVSKLVNGLRRDLEHVEPEFMARPAAMMGNMDLLWQIVQVGEALAVAGTAEYLDRHGSRSDNGGRVINSYDYAYLLRLYGERFWAIFRPEFLDKMPLTLQDDAMAVRGLLTTRFEANAVITEQLIKNVGLEPAGGGSAVVHNTSVVTASPVNTVVAKPTNAVHAAAAAASRAVQQGGPGRTAAIAIGSLAGLWLLKRVGILGALPVVGRFAGGGRRRRGRGRELLTDDGEFTDDGGRYSSRRGSGARGGRLSADQRLLLAFDHVDRQWKELSKAAKNAELLYNDWRLGPLRLAAPFGGPDPPGFQPLDLAPCEPRQFMHAQLGGGRSGVPHGGGAGSVV